MEKKKKNKLQKLGKIILTAFGAIVLTVAGHVGTAQAKPAQSRAPQTKSSPAKPSHPNSSRHSNQGGFCYDHSLQEYVTPYDCDRNPFISPKCCPQPAPYFKSPHQLGPRYLGPYNKPQHPQWRQPQPDYSPPAAPRDSEGNLPPGYSQLLFKHGAVLAYLDRDRTS